jgi:hypothetical protein
LLFVERFLTKDPGHYPLTSDFRPLDTGLMP